MKRNYYKQGGLTMASIDKIYGSNVQYDEFYSWCKEHNPSLLKHFYAREDFTHETDRPISNFSIQEDRWLVKNCPIVWVIARITEQYGIEWVTEIK